MSTSLAATTTPDSGSDPEKVVRRAWLDFVDRGWEGMLDHCTEDVTWFSMLASGRPVVGRDGIQTMFDGLAKTGLSYTAVPYRYGCVDGRVIVSVDVCVTQGGSRDADYHVYIVYHLEGERITRIAEFLKPDQALAAAGES